MKDFFIAFIFLSITITSQAQEKSPKSRLTFDYQLVVDNDAFTLDLSADQYYSSGIYPAVRWLADSAGRAKVIRSVQLNHRIFTPSWIGWNRETQLDRPYAGQVSASVANEYYFPSSQYLKVQLELGWMGPAVRMGETQDNWHRWFGMPQPRGWHYQINNTPIGNGYVTYIKPLYSSYNFEVSSETNLAFGTVFNYGRQELMFRAGNLRPMHRSAYSGAALGDKRNASSSQKTVESYLFYAPGFEYVVYNATIEGNLIGEKSHFTLNQINRVFQHRAGFMFSWPRFDMGFTAYWRTPENDRATRHKYASIRLNQRF